MLRLRLYSALGRSQSFNHPRAHLASGFASEGDRDHGIRRFDDLEHLQITLDQ